MPVLGRFRLVAELERRVAWAPTRPKREPEGVDGVRYVGLFCLIAGYCVISAAVLIGENINSYNKLKWGTYKRGILFP